MEHFMFKTKMTELFKIKYPIMLAGMNWVTEPALVSAVSNAGGLGILATARFTPKETRHNIKKIKELTDKPFGINQHLMGPWAKDNIEIAVEEKVPILNYSLGKPWFIDQVHSYGGKVIGTIATAKHATKAVQLGCDALVTTGHEAAAHGAETTSLVLIPIIASQTNLPLIAAGGFYDGRGLVAALALGADGISMGSRFLLTKECVLHDNFKSLCLAATEQDTLYSNAFDGMPSRVLKTKGALLMTRKGFPLLEAVKGAILVKQSLQFSFSKLIGLSIQMMSAEEGSPIRVQARRAASNMKHLKAIQNGDVDEGILFAGQCCGGIGDIPNCRELIERIIAEAEETLKALNAIKMKQ
jgi:enoyl-[acyl-carrier protein] reductase II